MKLPARKLVLVVEDEPSSQRRISRHLTDAGYDVLLARHVRDAIAILETTPPHVVCVDLVLPRESGYDLCEFMRTSETLRHIPVIAISERTSPLERAHAEEAGASRFLLKPVELDRLAQEVGALLADAPGDAPGNATEGA